MADKPRPGESFLDYVQRHLPGMKWTQAAAGTEEELDRALREARRRARRGELKAFQTFGLVLRRLGYATQAQILLEILAAGGALQMSRVELARSIGRTSQAVKDATKRLVRRRGHP